MTICSYAFSFNFEGLALSSMKAWEVWTQSSGKAALGWAS